MAARPPRAGGDLEAAAAVALAAPPAHGSGLSLDKQRPGARLRLNPLLHPVTLEVRWPSTRYGEEYGALSDHLRGIDPQAGTEELYRRRVLLDLPEAW